MSQTLLKITDLRHSLGGKIILKNFNGKIETEKIDEGHGEIIAILGPSGVGKTTLFKILSGIIYPDKGTIELLSRKDNMKYIHPRQGVMGVVAQKYPLFKHLTVLDNLKVTKKSKDECIEMLKSFGLEEHVDKYPCELSGGQQQRIAIAQQILCSDQFLLLDEPFSGEDLLSKCEICKMLKRTADLNETNTIIVITHGIDEAIKVANKIWLIGRDRDEKKNIIPGAYIKEVVDIDAKEMSRKCCSTPQLREVSDYITNKFKDL